MAVSTKNNSIILQETLFIYTQKTPRIFFETLHFKEPCVLIGHEHFDP